jgi:uncharacterized phage-associated protein
VYSALAIATKFISLGIQNSQPISPMKLQKIVYFAHGLHLARYGKALINENIQAWEYGPVIPVIYHQFKKWGNNPITESPKIGLLMGEKFIPGLDILDDDAEQTIRLAWDVTKEISASQLSNWSHTEGSPWSKTFNGVGSNPISNEEIKNYFSTQMQGVSNG